MSPTIDLRIDTRRWAHRRACLLSAPQPAQTMFLDGVSLRVRRPSGRKSIDRIMYSIFEHFNLDLAWKNRTLRVYTQAA